MSNRFFMRQAIDLGIRAMRDETGGPFGAVIVKDDQIIGQGQNHVLGRCDPTAHAELEAIRDSCQRLKRFDLQGCDIYTSCEPCPMCLGAIYWARLDNIYYAANRADAAAINFDDEYFYTELCKPRHNRDVPMTEILRQDSLAMFAEWQAKEDKNMY